MEKMLVLVYLAELLGMDLGRTRVAWLASV